MGKMFAENIKKLRKIKGITQEQLGEMLNITKTGISYWESGKSEPSLDTIKELAKIFDVTLSELLEPTLSSIPNIIPLEKMKRLPVLGTICAGNGIWCEESYDDYIMVDKHIKADFALTVKGDSMIDANIHNGDTAFFKKQNTAENGQIVAVLLTDENEATLKKVYYFEDGTTILQPCNPGYSPIINKKFMILGLLKGVYRDINQ